MLQKVGRHSGYTTQFWTGKRLPYRTRRDVLTAHSAKSIQRRLVLPLEEHNWFRALEVLGARYARLGRTASDYQRVIRGIASDSSPLRRRANIELLDSLRDQAYAGTLEFDNIWPTLLWAYVQLQQPREGYDCLLQAKRRAKYSPLTWRYMSEMLLPLLAKVGMLREVKYVLENFVNIDGSSVTRQEGAQQAAIVAEAAARGGTWAEAIRALGQSAIGGPSQVFSSLPSQGDEAGLNVPAAPLRSLAFCLS
ncbi:hypothetical protein ERJ75_000238800 [Trypanosoma vivax]|nr:hypothetical protein ERJ75_000238800 [Trypanosoma vivax]